MKKKTYYKSTMIKIFLLSIIFTGCEDVITVELQNAEPQIVIEGTITDGPGPYTVKITKTTDFYEPGIYEKVTGAVVLINDTYRNNDTLIEKEPGIYYTESLTPSYNTLYNLEVMTKGEKYEASTELKIPIILDSISVSEGDNPFSDEEIYDIHLYAQDNPGISDYAKMRIAVNGEYEKDYYLYEDRLTDGNYLEGILNIEKDKVNTGDTLTVEMSTINKAGYDFYSTLYQVLATSEEGFSSFTSAPANPKTNLNNGALGYFGAYSISTKSVVIE